MEYKYKDLLVYHRRSTTDNIAFKVVTDDFSLIENKSTEYIDLAQTLRVSEETSQLDACPLVGHQELHDVITAIRTKHPNLRARHTQMGAAVLTPADASINEEDALFESANGTLANLAASFTPEECDILVNKGILPILVKGNIPVGDYIFLEGIRSVIEQGDTKLEANIIREGYTPVELELAPLSEVQRTILLNQ